MFSACCCPFAFHGLHAERGKDKERPTRSADWTAGLHDTTHPPTTCPTPLLWSSHPHTTHPHTSHTHAHTPPPPPPPTPPPPHTTPHHTTHHTTPTAHSSRASGNKRRKCKRSAQKEPLGGDEVPFHQEVGALFRNHTAAWSRPHVPAMRSARVSFRVGKLRLVRSNRHPLREFGKHTKDVSQKTKKTRSTAQHRPPSPLIPSPPPPCPVATVQPRTHPASLENRRTATLHTPDLSTHSSRMLPLSTPPKNGPFASPTPLQMVARPPTPQHANPSPQSTIHTRKVVTGHA